MKFQIIISILISVSFISCARVGSRGDEVCDCFRLLVNEVDAQKVDFNNSAVSSTLQEIYNGLKTKNEDFKKCSDDFVNRYGTFGKAKIRLAIAINNDCTELDETLLKIAENGPLIFEMEKF